jgi:hypothetical protein
VGETELVAHLVHSNLQRTPQELNVADGTRGSSRRVPDVFSQSMGRHHPHPLSLLSQAKEIVKARSGEVLIGQSQTSKCAGRASTFQPLEYESGVILNA